MIVYRIPYRCYSKERPRFNAKTGATYMSPSYQKRKSECTNAIKENNDIVLLQGDLSVSIRVYYKGKGAGDIDNLQGFVLDAANQVLWEDDKQLRKIDCEILRNAGENFVVVIVEPYEEKDDLWI